MLGEKEDYYTLEGNCLKLYLVRRLRRISTEPKKNLKIQAIELKNVHHFTNMMRDALGKVAKAVKTVNENSVVKTRELEEKNWAAHVINLCVGYNAMLDEAQVG